MTLDELREILPEFTITDIEPISSLRYLATYEHDGCWGSVRFAEQLLEQVPPGIVQRVIREDVMADYRRRVTTQGRH